MLQRPQTLWILIAIIAVVCSFDNPFAVVNIDGDKKNLAEIDAGSTILLILMSSLSVALSSFAILSYNNLIRQKTLCWIGIMVSVVICLIFLRQWQELPDSELTLTSILPFLNPISLWLAWMGIDKDQKMLKKLSSKR